MKFLLAASMLGLSASAVIAHPAPRQASDNAAASLSEAARPAARVVDGFHAALRRGDQNAALNFLSDDALIYESGGVERGKAEYAAHHLAADAAFSKAVPGRVTRRHGFAAGNLAWIATEGRTTGAFKGKPVDVVTTETMVVRRIAGVWRIVHVHWSSAPGGK